MVPWEGIETATNGLRGPRSTNWAIAAERQMPRWDVVQAERFAQYDFRQNSRELFDDWFWNEISFINQTVESTPPSTIGKLADHRKF